MASRTIPARYEFICDRCGLAVIKELSAYPDGWVLILAEKLSFRTQAGLVCKPCYESFDRFMKGA